jgi:uncharacterized membrane protein YtjA (UPF0391 family)
MAGNATPGGTDDRASAATPMRYVARYPKRKEGCFMLTWAIIALVIALIAGALGFTGVAAAAGTVAKILFGLFLAIAIILFLMSLFAVA